MKALDLTWNGLEAFIFNWDLKSNNVTKLTHKIQKCFIELKRQIFIV